MGKTENSLVRIAGRIFPGFKRERELREALQELREQKKELLSIAQEFRGLNYDMYLDQHGSSEESWGKGYPDLRKFEKADSADRFLVKEKFQQRGLPLKAQDFERGQLLELEAAMDQGISNKEIMVFANPELAPCQMVILKNVMIGGLPPEQAAQFVTPDICNASPDKLMEQLREPCKPYPNAEKNLDDFHEWWHQDDFKGYEAEPEKAREETMEQGTEIGSTIENAKQSYLPAWARQDADGRAETVSSDFSKDALVQSGAGGGRPLVSPAFRTESWQPEESAPDSASSPEPGPEPEWEMEM